jgi:hypothetical protein
LVDEPGSEEALSAYSDADGIRSTATLLASAAESARTHVGRLRRRSSGRALAFAAGVELELACWDQELREAARKHGLILVPAHV